MNKTIKYAAIAGIISLIAVIPLTILEVLKVLNMASGLFAPYVLVYILSLVSYVIFTWGFKVVADKTKNNLLRVTSYLLIILSVVSYTYSILSTVSPSLENTLVSILVALSAGVVGILFGIGMLKLRKRFGSVATAAGILMIVSSASMLTIILVFVSILTLIPTYILQIMLLLKASKKL